MDVMHPCPCAVRYPEGEEMVDDYQFVYIPHRIGKSTLLCGKKSSYFPYQLFVGPEWYCSFVTYALIIVLTVFFLANVAVSLGPAVIVLGSISLFVTVMLFSATACSDPGIIFKYTTPSVHNTLEDDQADDDDDDDDDDDGDDDIEGLADDHDIEIANTSGASMGSMNMRDVENLGGVLEDRQGLGLGHAEEEQQAMVAIDMHSDSNHLDKSNPHTENKTELQNKTTTTTTTTNNNNNNNNNNNSNNKNSNNNSSSYRPAGKQQYVGVVPSPTGYTPYPAPTGHRRGDRASRKTNGTKNSDSGGRGSEVRGSGGGGSGGRGSNGVNNSGSGGTSRGGNGRSGGNRGGRGITTRGNNSRGNNNNRGGSDLVQSGVGPNGEEWTMECSICQVT